MDINQQKEPEIAWKFPPKIKLDKDIELELNEEGKESEEKKYIQDYCDSQLRVRYFDQIPEPLEIEKKAIMFSFTDENIPKIENSQIATKTNDVTINDVSEFWNNICQKNITQENINQLKELLAKTNDINNEKKKEILEGAQKKYEQEILMNQINGKGKFTWQNGDVYEGIMFKGKMNGWGKYTYASNGQIYIGDFVNGVKRGNGKIIYPNGKIYEGKFINGVPQGQGIITENGQSTQVVFRNGKAYGYNFN